MTLTLLSLALAQEAPAQESLPEEPVSIGASADTSPEIDLSFPASLAERGYAQEAWLEYERVAFALPPGLAADRAHYLAGEALLSLQRRDLAAGLDPGPAAAASFREAPVSPASAPLFLFAEVEAHSEARRYPLAEARLAALRPQAPAEYAPALAYREAWLRLRAGDPTAPDYFDAVPGEGALALAGDHFAAELRALPPLPTRSPLAAGLLSALLPGAGQLYAGEPRDALSALALNGLFMGGTAALVRQRAWPAVALTGLFTLGFYTGNIVSAANAASRRNQRYARARMEELSRAWELHLELEEAAPGEPLEPEFTIGGP